MTSRWLFSQGFVQCQYNSLLKKIHWVFTEEKRCLRTTTNVWRIIYTTKRAWKPAKIFIGLGVTMKGEQFERTFLQSNFAISDSMFNLWSPIQSLPKKLSSLTRLGLESYSHKYTVFTDRPLKQVKVSDRINVFVSAFDEISEKDQKTGHCIV